MIDQDVRYVLTDQGRADLRAAVLDVKGDSICPKCFEPWIEHVGTWATARLCWVELRWDE